LFVSTKDLPALWIDEMKFVACEAMFSPVDLPCFFSVGAGVFDPALHSKAGIRAPIKKRDHDASPTSWPPR
jgi:hypothetical protein